MSLYLINPTDIKLMPIRAISIFEGSGTFTDIFYLERGSYVNFEEVTTRHSQGGVVTVGYTMKAELKVPFNNNYPVLLEKLKGFQKRISEPNSDDSSYWRRDIQILLGEADPYDAGTEYTAPEVINANEGMWIDLGTRPTLTYSLGTLDYRPQLTIKLNGSYTIDEIVSLFTVV